MAGRPSRSSRTAALLLGMLLTACTGDPPGSSDVQNEGSPKERSAPVEPVAEPALLGSAEGLGFGERKAPFGVPLTDAVEVAEVAGAKSDPPQKLEECGAGPLVAVRVGNISLYGQGERFAGWHISEKDPIKLRTDRGVTIGTSRSELETRHSVEVSETTVGTEFLAPGGLGGLLADSSPTAEVAHLWAGTTCIMR